VAVPVRKKSKAKRDSRRSQHDKMTLPGVVICDNCGADVPSHRACPSCGWYRDRVVLVIEQPEDFDEPVEE
jgi:large subunit ribosomal protein L32